MMIPSKPPTWFGQPMPKSQRRSVLRYTMTSLGGVIEVQQYDHVRYIRGLWQATWQGRMTDGETAQEAITKMELVALKFAREVLALEAGRAAAVAANALEEAVGA